MHPTFSLGSLELPSYFTVISLIFTLAVVAWHWQSSHFSENLRTFARYLPLVLIGGGFLGARLLHVVAEGEGLYYRHPELVFSIWQGGFVFYGGLIGGFLAGRWWHYFVFREPQFAETREANWKYWADVLWPYCNLGYAFGRVACFLNGCCYGNTCDLPWSLQGRHPVQLYVVGWELLTFVWITLSFSKRKKRPPGLLFFVWILAHATGRFWMEQLRDDPRGESFLGFSQGSWISVGLVLWALFHLGLSVV